MLSREQAESILKAAKLENPNVVLTTRIKTLEAELAKKTLDFLLLDENGQTLEWTGEKAYERRRDFTEASKKTFYAITPSQLDAVIETWFPKFADVVRIALKADLVSWRGYRSKQPLELEAQIQQCHYWRSSISEYDQSLEWFAEYATYINDANGNQLISLFVAAINTGNKAMLEMFIATCLGEHPVSVMGYHVIQTLLQANQEHGWEIIEKVLLAAQRQEGLRQSIFNAISVAHPEALKRMLNFVLEHDLLRFSSSVQWARGYLPLLPPEPTPKVLENVLRDCIQRFKNPDSSRELLRDLTNIPDLDAFYLANHALARINLQEQQNLLMPWFEHPHPEMRYAAVHLFFHFEAKQDIQAQLQKMLSDSDERVAIQAFSRIQFLGESQTMNAQAFILLERFLQRFPNKVVFPEIRLWLSHIQIEPNSIVAKMFTLVEKTNPRAMLPYRSQMNGYTQANLIQILTKETPWDTDVRELVMQGLSGKEDYARNSAIKAITEKNIALEEHEFASLEKLLSRKTADIRKQAMSLILTQAPALVALSAARLQKAKTPEQKKAGTEILQVLEDRKNLENLPSPSDGYGLFDPSLRSSASEIKTKQLVLMSKTACDSITSFGALVKSQLQVVVQAPKWDGSIEEIAFANYREISQPNISLEEQWKAVPLHDLWENWYAEQPNLNGLELARALAIVKIIEAAQPNYYQRNQRNKELQATFEEWVEALGVDKDFLVNIPLQTFGLLTYLAKIHATPEAHGFALDLLEHQLAVGIPILQNEYQRLMALPQPEDEQERHSWRWNITSIRQNTEILVTLELGSVARDSTHDLREWKLLQTRQTLIPWRKTRISWNLELGLKAYQAGIASQADIWDWLIGPESEVEPLICRTGFTQFTTKKPDVLLAKYPELLPMITMCSQRVLELELKRGDLPTSTSAAASTIAYLEGLDKLVAILQALGQDSIVRVGHYIYGEQARNAVFSRLLRVTHPAPSDTPKAFAAALKGVPEQRLLELGLFAPQWIGFVAHAVGWKGLDDAMYWLLAHTKESGWGGTQQELEGWKAEMAQLTPLSTQDLMDGAVDVAWFNNAYKELGATRWAQLYEAAKYTSSGTGHARAKQFADAMLGKLEESEVQKRITDKRHQDSVRAFGLLPLPKTKDVTLLKRYEIVQTFMKGAKKFGSQRKESENLAARIGLENLARTAGYPDPMRLEWAMELKAVADLAKGAVKLVKGDVEFVLSVSEDGEPNFEILKKGKVLKDIPANLRKDEAVVEIRARRKELEVQRSRMRVSLERAMVHGDQFSAKELRELTKHPIVRPMLEQLIFMSETQMGFLSSDGKNLVNANGELLEITSKTLRLAHPMDLLESGIWSEFQGTFFSAKRQQPFKQIFRELYLLTPAEKLEKTKSSRYAGHQINQHQSVALLGSRNWVVPYEDDASRTFFAEGITAHVSSKYGWTTPAEVEAPALDSVYFTKRNDYNILDLETIPKRLYSEVMRDLDLVVSVAHVGGVDPEASQSTTEMRAALLLETLRLLKIDNVKLEKSVVLIEGSIGRYSVHLGSAVVHQQPGGAICLVAIPNQARGRIFLPFADSDPRTAEVIAKVLMLAKDSEIQDPILLRQLVG
jgi:hypothetical protein